VKRTFFGGGARENLVECGRGWVGTGTRLGEEPY